MVSLVIEAMMMMRTSKRKKTHIIERKRWNENPSVYCILYMIARRPVYAIMP